MIYGVENSGPSLGEAHKCGRIKAVSSIPNPPKGYQFSIKWYLLNNQEGLWGLFIYLIMSFPLTLIWVELVLIKLLL
jgi:hypothetical protein